MTSVSNMISRLETIKRQYYAYSWDEVMKLEELALMDEMLSALREISIRLAVLNSKKDKEAKE